MALKFIQVTIGAAATQVTTTRTPAVYAVIEADSGNSNPAFIGDSAVSSAKGIRLNNSATVPGRMTIGAFSAIIHFDLSRIYIAGTQNEKVNILYVTY